MVLTKGSGIAYRPRLGNCLDVFAYDRITSRIKRVSISTNGAQSDGESWSATISTDGRWVSFRSRARNLAPEFNAECNKLDFPENCHGIYIHELETSETELITVLSAYPNNL